MQELKPSAQTAPDNAVNENAGASFPDAEATQRLNINTQGVPVPQQKRPVAAPAKDASSRPSSGQPVKNKKAKTRRAMTRRDKITIITLISITLLLIAGLIITATYIFKEPEDDGLILKGVIAAGVNLGGMTPDEAKAALEEATANTYTKLDMTVTVLDTTIHLAPKDTRAKLDIDAVVQDAFNYGRTGSRTERQQAKNHALANSYIVPITPHLNLNTDFIRSEINKLGSQFSSTLAQPTITFTGTRPEIGVPTPDTTIAHQTMSIFMGTPEYGLDTGKLYEQVLEYYNINIFQVVGTCTVVAPESVEPELMKQYNEVCVAPVDAQIDSVTYEIAPEIYGYGFDLDQVKEQIASANYGETIEVSLYYIAPNLTKELLSGNLFKDTLAKFTSPLGKDKSWNHNVTNACRTLNGTILKSGDTFSFNDLFGELTKQKGYVQANAFVDKRQASIYGGGVAQVASALYNSALKAGFEIIELSNHAYATDFIEVGRDAYISNQKADFCFRNTLPDPVRIDAQVDNNSIKITIVGTDSRDYLVEIESLVVNTQLPGQLNNYMNPDNPGKFKEGQVLTEAIIGYDVEIYRYKYNKDSGRLISKDLLYTAHYDPRDAVIISLGEVPTTDPTDPSDPSNPTVPSDPTTPSDPTIPSDPTTPSNPTVPSDPTDPSTQDPESTSEPTTPTEDPTQTPTEETNVTQ